MGAFDYGSKGSQQRVAFIGKSYPMRANTQPVGTKAFNVTCTPGAFKKALEISGSGAINFAAMSIPVSISDTIRLRVTIDSRVIVDASAAVTTSYQGFSVIGNLLIDTTNGICNYSSQRIPFEKSLLIECTDTAGTAVNVYVDYEVNA